LDRRTALQRIGLFALAPLAALAVKSEPAATPEPLREDDLLKWGYNISPGAQVTSVLHVVPSRWSGQ
jgi:hypothetical protein